MEAWTEDFRPALSMEYQRDEISEEQLALAEAGALTDNDIQFRLNCPVANIDAARCSAVHTDGCRLR